MKRNGSILGLLFAILVLSQVAPAAELRTTATNRFTAIVQRNAFNLIPLKFEHSEPPPRPLAKVILTGIFSFPGDRRALLKVVLPPIPPEPARECLLMLREGEAETTIRLLEIDEDTGSVKVDNDSTIMVLTFDSP